MQTTNHPYETSDLSEKIISVTRFRKFLLNCLPAFLFVFLAVDKTVAATITIDGNVTPLTIVSNNIYQSDELVLENGANLLAESNAVINTVSVNPATPSSTITMNVGSYVSAIAGSGVTVIVNGGNCSNFELDQSSVTIFGMDAGSDGSLPNLFLGAFVDGDTFTINGGNYSGIIAYLTDANLTINGGNFASGGAVLMNAPQGTNQMIINGGVFEDVTLIAYGPLFIHGGTFTGSISFADTFYIDGGIFGNADANSCVLYPTDASYVAAGYAPAVYIAGGNFYGANSGYFNDTTYPYDWNMVVQGSALDESSYDPANGGTLGVKFCSGITTSVGLIHSYYGHVPTITQDVCSEDSDGDGVPDNADQCIYSDLSSTVMIGNRDSGVANQINGSLVNAAGCSLADLIHAELVKAATGAKNHGQYVKTMAAYLNGLISEGIIDSSDMGALMSCIASSDENQFAQ